MEKYILTHSKKTFFEYQIFPRKVNCILINSTGKEIGEGFSHWIAEMNVRSWQEKQEHLADKILQRELF